MTRTGHERVEARAELRPLADETMPGDVSASAEVLLVDGRGHYRLAVPSLGMWTVRISADGFTPQELVLSPLLEGVELPSLVLAPDAGLWVRVLDPAGEALAGARVRAAPDGSISDRADSGWHTAAFHGRTGDDGRVRIPRAPGERFTVWAHGSGFAESVPMSPDLESQALEITLRSARPRTLVVVDPGGAALPGVEVGVGSQAWPVGRTDTEGRQSVQVPVAAPLAVTLEGADGRRGRALVRPDPSHPAIVELAPAVELAGRVVARDSGEPVPGAIAWQRDEPTRFDLADAQGHFRLNVPTGEPVTLSAAAAGYFPSELRFEPTARTSTIAALALVRATAVRGVVTDTEGRPLAAAEIELRAVKRPGRPLVSTLTRADGSFRFASLALGRYELHARKAGYGAVRRPVAADGPEATRPAVRIEMRPGRHAFGRVWDASEQPVPKARVSLLAAAGHRQGPIPNGPLDLHAKTGADGDFAFDAVAAGTFRLVVRADGFAPMVVPGLEVPAGDEAWDLGTLLLDAGTTLHGRVVDGAAVAVDGAEVTAVASSGPGGGAEAVTTRTDTDGSFVLRELVPVGRVDLTVRAPGYALKIVAGVAVERYEEIRIVLAAGARLAGSVVDPGGRPIEGAMVEVAGAENDAMSSGVRVAVTDAAGTFALDDLEPGRVTIHAAADGFRRRQPQALELTPGIDVTETVLVLDRGATVAGRLSLADGTPVPSALIELRCAADGSSTATARSDAQGRYRMTGAGPGEHLLSARHPSYRPTTERIEVRSGVNHYDLLLESGPEVSGRVISADGTAVSGALVTLIRQEGPADSLREGRSGVGGGFRIGGLAAGRYRLRAEAEGFGPALLPHEIEVGDTAIDGLELVLWRGGTIAGELRGLGFDELALVEVTGGSAGHSVRGEVEPAFGYRLRDLPAGEWTITATLPVTGRRAIGRTILEPEGAQAVLDLDFTAGLTFAGRILVDGRPAAGVWVRLRGPIHATTTASHDGSFHIGGLEPGEYELAVIPGASRWRHVERLTLAADRRMTLEITTSGLTGQSLEEVPGI